MSEICDLDRNSLFAEFHCERSNHECCFESAAFNRFNDGGEIRKSLRLKSRRGARPRCEISDRTGQMTGYWQETHFQFSACVSLLLAGLLCDSAPGLKP